MPTFPLFQHAYVVNDLERSANGWSELLGAGPFSIRAHHRALRFEYRGTAAGGRRLLRLRLSRRHDDPAHPATRRHPVDLPRDVCAGRGGLPPRRHARARLPGRQAVDFLDQGFEVACALWADGVDAAYFDTRSVTGGFTEIHGDPPYILETFANYRRAHEAHRPGDPAVLQRSEGTSPRPGDPARHG